MSHETILLAGADVRAALPPRQCIQSVEAAMRRSALGEVAPSGILGMHAPAGGYHVKAGLLDDGGLFFAAKVNANFPHNSGRFGLPTIQGAVLLFDGDNGRLLAILDSMSLTALRTAAASAVAARYLARPSSRTLLLCGCGAQALDQVRAIACVRPIQKVLVHDIVPGKAEAFALAAQGETDVELLAVTDLDAGVRQADVVVTCTTSKAHFLESAMVSPGTFIAAVGADHEEKQELAPDLMAKARVVTDSTDQAARIGDLHHAIAAGAMRAAAVHAELGQLAAGLKPGRGGDEEITVFDSTGLGLQDVAAAIAVYRGALGGAAGSVRSIFWE